MRKRIRKWTSLIGVMALAFVLAMGIVTPEIFAAYTYTASQPNPTTEGKNFWNLPKLLELSVSISGSSATFTVKKVGGNFTSNGKISLKVCTPKCLGDPMQSWVDRLDLYGKPVNKDVNVEDQQAILNDNNLDNWPSGSSSTTDYYVLYEPIDPNGYRWVWVGPITITRQAVNQPPTVSITNCQSIINGPSYTFNWIGNGDVSMYYYGLDDSTPDIPTSGTSYTWTGLVNGSSHTFYVKARDNLGLDSIVASCSFKVNSPPTINSLNCPTSVVTTPSYPFNWIGSDPDGDSLQYYYGLETTTPDSLIITNFHTWENLSNGTHTFSVKARDKWGADSPVVICSFNVEVPPWVKILNCPTERLKASSNYTFNWIGNVSKYSVSLDSGTEIDVGAATSYQWKSLSSGEHTFVVKAYGPKDVATAKCEKIYVNVPPTVEIKNCPTSPLTTSSHTFEWSGSDSDGTIAKYYILLGNVKIDIGTATSYEWKDVINGTHKFSVQAQDNSGDYSTVASCEFDVNVPRPTVSITNCPWIELGKSSYTFNWSGTGSISKYFYGLDNSNPDIEIKDTSYTWTDIVNGNHTFYVKAQDISGVFSDVASCGIFVDAPPIVEIKNCPKDTLGTSSYTFEWKGNVSQYYYCLDELPCVLTSATSYKWENLTNGEHTFKVIAHDFIDSEPAICSFEIRPEFNITIQLLWKDYQRVTREYDAAVWGDGWPGCGSNTDTNEYTQHIPFKQEVILSRNLLHDCRDTGSSTSYLTEGDANWVYFTTQTNLSCEGDLRLKVYAKNDPDSGFNCTTKCSVNLYATYYDVTPTTNQKKVIGPEHATLPAGNTKTEIKRFPVPTSQFNDKGLTRDFKCDVTTDSSDVALCCEQDGNDFVVYAYPKAEVVTVQLSWQDYKLTKKDFTAAKWGDGWPSCASRDDTNVYSQNIPFGQMVKLNRSLDGHCRNTDQSTKYRKKGAQEWTAITAQESSINLEGDLEFQIYAQTDPRGSWSCFCDCATKCSVSLTAAFYDKTPTSEQHLSFCPQFIPDPIPETKQELMRVPAPKSQFGDNIGLTSNFKCDVVVDKSSAMYIWCEQQGNEFVVYAYPKADLDKPVAPFASIISIEGSGERVENGVKVITAVKWKDDEFDTKHDPVKFVGQATDIDGSIVEYRWEVDGKLLSDKPSFSATDLTLGSHAITFIAKDSSGLWSNVGAKIVKVTKPPLLLVHGINGSYDDWDYQIDRIKSAYHDVKAISIHPNAARFYVGAKQVSEAVKELSAEYGVPKVNILAHSMGGLNSRWYIQGPGYRNDVNKLVMLGTPNHGSTLAILGRPKDAGSHASLYMSSIPLTRGLSLLIYFLDHSDGVADLIPGSSALRQLNGNKKDEGFTGNEPADNIRTVYGSNVQYFNVYGTGILSISHRHIRIFGTNYNIVLPIYSTDTDFFVARLSNRLDGVPSYGFNDMLHGHFTIPDVFPLIPPEKRELYGLNSRACSIDKALYYLGDDPPETDPSTEPNTDITKALAAHPIFAPKNGEYSAVSAEQPQEQKFDVEAGIRNINVMLMPPLKDGDKNLFSLRLIEPSGEIIDENTNFPDVKYDPKTMVYQIFNVEPGTWTAEISTTSGMPLKYALLVMGETDFWIGVREESQIEPGKPIVITAYAQKEGKPAPGLKVKASVLRTFDEGERIGSKYGKDLRDAEPEEVELNDLGDGRYEMNYTNTLASGTYRVFVTATDPASNVSRMAFTTFFVEYSYDFSIQSADISFSNNSPQSNEMVTVSATVHNNTPIEAKGIEVIFSDGSLGKDGKTFGKTVIDLPASGTAVASLSWRIPAGLHDVFVIVSPMNTFIEENIQNNIASKAIATPDRSPTANAGGKERIVRFDVGNNTNFPIVLDASGSTDDLRIEKYEWDMNTNVDSNGDGIPDNDADFTGVRAVIPKGTYSAEGDYQIKLTVTDSNGQKSSDTMTVHLKDAYDFEPPKANAGKFQTVPAGYPIQFDGSASTDNFGIVAYMWDTDINVDSNGDGIPDNDVDLIGMKPVFESGYPSKGIHTAKLTVSDAVGNLASSTVKVSVSDFKGGVFVVDSTGIIKIDWLYDGGKYQGEFGIFSMSGMENLTPGSPEFIAEAVKRVVSNSDQGYLVFSDLQEGARFSGILGNEIKDWNAGQYKGLKNFAMPAGTQFATILVPNSTFASLSQNTGTEDPNKRPLFSLVSSNPTYGMYMGQMADINGMGKAFTYEDKDADTSDWDFNDLILTITGAESNLPTLDSLVGICCTRSKRDKRDNSFTDWRTNSELGKLIMAHVGSSPTTNPITVTLKGSATLLVYDAQGGVIGKSGGTLIGAGFEMNADTQTVTLPDTGSYRIVIQGVKAETCQLSVKNTQGNLKEIQVDTALHQVSGTTTALETPTASASYDFNGDGVTDNTDVEMLVRHWNSCKGQQKYDPFFDVNDDGCIPVADSMTVLTAKTVK